MPRAVAVVVTSIAAVAVIACRGAHRSTSSAVDLDRAAESYVRLVLALGERDTDSLDSYHGPPAWQAEARTRHAPLEEVQRDAAALADKLVAEHVASGEGGGPARQDDVEIRRAFLVRQLRAVVARIEILRGARPSFEEEAQRLFGLRADRSPGSVAPILAEIERELPGRGPLASRFAAFDRQFLIAADRLPVVIARAIAGCRAATVAHLPLPPSERVDVAYVRDLPWSAFTRYGGQFRSTIQINAALPLTIDRALDLACHEAYPGHHTIATMLETRFSGRVEFRVQPAFSPQSLLHESASSNASALAFTEPERVALERDELFPLAGLNPADAGRHVRVARLVDRLHPVEADIARRYLDGELDFARASLALEHDALMPSADAAMKFLNQYRSYAATYTIGRDLFWRHLSGVTNVDAARWHSYIDLVTNPAQMLR